MAFASGVAGALCVRFLPRSVLEVLIPVLLIVIAIYFARSRKVQDADASARMTALTFGLTAPVAIGFYDGIFGPGAGSFYMLAFVMLLGYGVVRATAHTKLLNFCEQFRQPAPLQRDRRRGLAARPRDGGGVAGRGADRLAAGHAPRRPDHPAAAGRGVEPDGVAAASRPG